MAAWCQISFGSYMANPLGRLYLNGNEVIDLKIPEGITAINDFAFLSCGSLTSVSIPNSVTSIGCRAFYGCSSLKTVYCYATTPPDVYYEYDCGDDAPSPFEDCSSLTIHVPVGQQRQYAKRGWKKFGNIKADLSCNVEDVLPTEEENEINQVPDEMPEFPGGD